MLHSVRIMLAVYVVDVKGAHSKFETPPNMIFGSSDLQSSAPRDQVRAGECAWVACAKKGVVFQAGRFGESIDMD